MASAETMGSDPHVRAEAAGDRYHEELECREAWSAIRGDRALPEPSLPPP